LGYTLELSAIKTTPILAYFTTACKTDGRDLLTISNANLCPSKLWIYVIDLLYTNIERWRFGINW